jgi:hypothetical protein
MANYVHIVTGKNIPVEIKGQDSYTDGSSVTISADIKPEELDVAVGLALHEGSHIHLTDFTILPNLANEAKEFWKDYDSKPNNNRLLKDILNVVEDRRIDNFIYTTSPGCTGYYVALYKKYFQSAKIDKSLISKRYNKQTPADYMFHIINFANANRKLDTLPGLEDIWNLLDLYTIQRLKNTKEALGVSVEILKVILANVPDSQQDYKGMGDLKGRPQGQASEEEQQEEGQQQQSSGTQPEDDKEEEDGSGGGGKGQEEGEEQDGAGGSGESDDDMDSILDQLGDFLEHEMEKKELSRSDSNQLESLKGGNVDIQQIGKDKDEWGGTSTIPNTTAVVVNKLTKPLVDSGVINGLSSHPINEQAVKEGILMGKKLAHYLRARQETRTLKTTRLKNGRMDRRLISQLGYGDYEVFSNVTETISNSAHIHISIDASGSMGGQKIYKSIKTAVAIATAATKIQGIDCVIDFRHQTENGQPCVIVGYDSRTQKPSELRMIQYVNTDALTPEGLCYEAVLDYLVKTDRGKDSYLINFSDGYPAFTVRNPGGKSVRYKGELAYKHTKKQIDAIKKKGINVLSYFIEYGTSGEPDEAFKKMYGNSAVAIDTDNLQQVARTVNKLLMK